MNFEQDDFCTEIVTENPHFPFPQPQDNAHA